MMQKISKIHSIIREIETIRPKINLLMKVIRGFHRIIIIIIIIILIILRQAAAKKKLRDINYANYG